MLQGISASSTSLLHRAPQNALIATVVLIMGHAFVQSCGADIMIWRMDTYRVNHKREQVVVDPSRSMLLSGVELPHGQGFFGFTDIDIFLLSSMCKFALELPSPTAKNSLKLPASSFSCSRATHRFGHQVGGESNSVSVRFRLQRVGEYWLVVSLSQSQSLCYTISYI